MGNFLGAGDPLPFETRDRTAAEQVAVPLLNHLLHTTAIYREKQLGRVMKISSPK